MIIFSFHLLGVGAGRSWVDGALVVNDSFELCSIIFLSPESRLC